MLALRKEEDEHTLRSTGNVTGPVVTAAEFDRRLSGLPPQITREQIAWATGAHPMTVWKWTRLDKFPPPTLPPGGRSYTHPRDAVGRFLRGMLFDLDGSYMRPGPPLGSARPARPYESAASEAMTALVRDAIEAGTDLTTAAAASALGIAPRTAEARLRQVVPDLALAHHLLTSADVAELLDDVPVDARPAAAKSLLKREPRSVRIGRRDYYHWTTVERLLKERPPYRPAAHTFREDELARMCRLYEEGWSANRIATDFGVHNDTIRKRLADMGVRLRDQREASTKPFRA